MLTAMPRPSPSGSSAAFTARPPDLGEGRPHRPPLACHHGGTRADRRSEEHIRGPVGAGVDTRVGDASRERGQRGAEGRPHQSGAEGERHGGGGVARGHGGAGWLGMDEPERRKVFRQRAGPRQQGLETEVRDRGRDGLCQQPVDGGTARPPGEERHHGGDADPELALVRRGGQPPEEIVMTAAGEAGHGAHQLPVESPEPARRLPQHASHATTLLPARAAALSGGAREMSCGSRVRRPARPGWLGWGDDPSAGSSAIVNGPRARGQHRPAHTGRGPRRTPGGGREAAALPGPGRRLGPLDHVAAQPVLGRDQRLP